MNPLDNFLKTEFHFNKPPKKGLVSQGPAPQFLMQFRLVDQALAKQAILSREDGVEPDWITDDEDRFWAQPFSVDQLDDFQTQIVEEEAARIGEAVQAQHPQWNEPHGDNGYRRVVRVIITSNSQDDDATLLIILENPATEEFVIKNKTGIPLELFKYDRVKKRALDQVPTLLDGYSSMPFVWDNRDINDKNILFRQPDNQKKKATASLDQVSKFDQKKKELKQNALFNLKVMNPEKTEPRIIQLYTVLKVNEMSTKILSIYHKELDPKTRRGTLRNEPGVEAQLPGDDRQGKQQEEEYLGIDQQHLLEYEDPENAKGAKGIEFSLHLKGMGISIIDNQPKELFYATLSDFKVDLKMSTSTKRIRKKNNNLVSTKTDFRMSVGNLQIDNMLDDQMSVVFCPAKLYKDLVLTERNYDEMGALQKEYRAIEPIEKVLKKKDVLDQ